MLFRRFCIHIVLGHGITPFRKILCLHYTTICRRAQGALFDKVSEARKKYFQKFKIGIDKHKPACYNKPVAHEM